ncbi:MAG: hypothetical protein AAFR62_19050 [Cyanobacteria bacterium J06629_2]
MNTPAKLTIYASLSTKASALEGRSFMAEGRRFRPSFFLHAAKAFVTFGFKAPARIFDLSARHGEPASPCVIALLAVNSCWWVRIPLQLILLPSAFCLLPSAFVQSSSTT